MKRNPDAARYLRQVKRHLICPMRYRRTLLKQLRTDVAAYINENQLADFDSLVVSFGNPKDKAESMIISLPMAVLRRSMNALPLCLIVIVMLAIAITGCYLATDHYIDNRDTPTYDFTIEIGPDGRTHYIYNDSPATTVTTYQ